MTIEEFVEGKVNQLISTDSFVEKLNLSIDDVARVLSGRTTLYADDEVAFVNNMNEAYHFVLKNKNHPNDLFFIREVHRIIGIDRVYGVGDLRDRIISINGTDWKPSIPIQHKVDVELKFINSIPDSIDRAIALFDFLVRHKIFLGCNKLVAWVMANKVLMQKEIGVLMMPIAEMKRFNKLLIGFYETANGSELDHFLKNNCIIKM